MEPVDSGDEVATQDDRGRRSRGRRGGAGDGDGRRSAADAFRELDARDREDEAGEPPEERASMLQRLRRQLLWVIVAALGLSLVGFGGGWVFARFSGPNASRLVLGDRVEVEERSGDEPPAADTAPTWGESDEEARCGVATQPAPPDVQVAVLDAGGAVIQYRPEAVGGQQRAELEELPEAFGSHVLVAPNPDLEEVVVATAWEHRLTMDAVQEAALRAFIEGYAAPPDAPEAGCPLVR